MIFPPSFLDSSSWNDNQLDFEQHAHHQQQVAAASCGGGGAGDGGCNNHELLQPSIMQQGTLAEGGDGGGGGCGQVVGPAKPMSMSERARLARVPLPEQGLKCPRCDSANTKFCYFNNYSLSQPRHFCRACRRYWTRGGALRNVPVGGGYRRHAKRAKPKQAAAAAAAGAPAANGAASGGSTTTYASTTMSNPTPVLPAMLQNGGGGNLSGLLPPLLRLADFDAMSLGSTFSGMGKSSAVDSAAGYYLGGGGGGAVAGLEQWRAQQMQGFPFFQAMADQQHTLGPAAAPAMAMPGMFHYLGLGNGGDGRGGHEDDGGDQQFHHAMPSKREGYPRSGSIGMYGGDHHLTAGGGYTSSYANTATGNHLL